MNRFPLIAVFSLVFISGCVQFEGLFGGAGTTVEAPDDVLIIKNAVVVPQPPIPADSNFDLSFEVVNTGEAETGKEATGVRVYAFDWGRCKPVAPNCQAAVVPTQQFSIVFVSTSLPSFGVDFEGKEISVASFASASEVGFKVSGGGSEETKNVRINEEQRINGLYIRFDRIESYGGDTYSIWFTASTSSLSTVSEREDTVCVRSDGQLVGIPGQPTPIFPGEGSRLVEWEFKAPTNDELGRVQGRCIVKYKVGYDFKAFTIAELVIIDEERLKQLGRAGERATAEPLTSKSKGPIKIDIQIGSKQPVRENSTVPLNFVVEDKGNGVMREIPAGKLVIRFDSQFASKVSEDQSVWQRVSDTVFTNKGPVLFIKKKTPPMRIDIVAPDVADSRTFTINAVMEYRYELFDETEVAVTPTAVR